MNSALKKINARAKVLKKKHPGKKYKTLQKQAGKEYKAGKLKTRRKRVGTVKKARPKKRAVVRKKRVLKVKPIKERVYRAKRSKVKAYTATRYKRVSGKGKSIMPLVALAAVGVAAYLLLKPKTVLATNYGYMPTGNPVRDNSANSILTWATAAQLTAGAIAKLIQAINNSDDSTVKTIADNPSAIPAGWIA